MVLVVVLLLLEDDSLLGDVPVLGEEPVFTVVFVSVLFSVAGEAEGFTTVVLFSVLLSPDGGLAVSVFCSQAANNDNDATPARMQMYFFIVG